jgi:hypothetical protein
MGCAVSTQLQIPKKRKKRAQLKEYSSNKESNSDNKPPSMFVQNEATTCSFDSTKPAESEIPETAVEDNRVPVNGPYSATRTLSKRISDKVAYFEQLSRQISEEPKLTKRNSAYSKWKIEDEPRRNSTAPIDWQHIPRERRVFNEHNSSLSTREIFAEDTRLSERITSWSDTVQQLRNEHFLENYLLDKSLKRRSSKLGA